MTPSPEDLAAQYAQMSETELMELARSYDGLLEIAQVALRAEFARRGLEPPLVEEPEEWEFRRLVTVRRYRDLAEAYVGRSLLESAGIPAWIADEHLVRMDWFYSNLVDRTGAHPDIPACVHLHVTPAVIVSSRPAGLVRRGAYPGLRVPCGGFRGVLHDGVVRSVKHVQRAVAVDGDVAHRGSIRCIRY